MINILLPTVIIRHRRENLKKCSLTGLEKREELLFFSYPGKWAYDFSSYIALTLDNQAPLLSAADSKCGLLLLDGTWRLAEKIAKVLCLEHLPLRSLPSHFQTAYPRRQADCSDPLRGLASVEALYISHFLMGKNYLGLLDHYHWKEKFLQLNEKHIMQE